MSALSASASLFLGDFDLQSHLSGTADHDSLTDGEDATWGNPEPVERVVKSLMQDGSSVVTDSYDNRTATLLVRLTASDPVGLADAEDALFAEVGHANQLVWTPRGDVTVPTVFEVVTSRLEHEYDNVSESVLLERLYRLTLTCAPFARSQDPTVTPAIDDGTSPVPDPVTLDDGTSAANWSADQGYVYSNGSYVYSDNTLGGGGPARREATLTRTFSTPVDLSTRRYVSVDIQYRLATNEAGFNLYIDGVLQRTRVAIEPAPTSGWIRYTWKAEDGTTSASQIGVEWTERGSNPNTNRDRWMRLDNLMANNVTPLSGSNRQKIRSFDVGGAVRTPGALTLAHPSDPLGSTLIYTWPDDGTGYSPPMRRWRTAGNVATSDPASASGATSTLQAASEFTIPAAQIPPGLYLPVIFAIASAATSGNHWDVTLNASLQFGGVDVGQASEITADVQFYSGSYGIRELGLITLPPTATPGGTTADLRVTLSVDSNGAELTLDELWLFNVSDGRLTRVNSVAHSNLWLETPSLSSQRYAVYVGDSEDQSDAYAVLPAALQRHEFTPGTMNVLTMTEGAENVGVSFSHYERWHTHARR